jgi:hypothetical protein
MTTISPAMLAKSKGAITSAAFVDPNPRKVVKVDLTIEELICEINHFALGRLDHLTAKWNEGRQIAAYGYLAVLVYGNTDPDFQVEINLTDRDKVRYVFTHAMYIFRNLVRPDERQQIPGTKPHKRDWYDELYRKVEFDNRNEQPAITVEELNIDPS